MGGGGEGQRRRLRGRIHLADGGDGRRGLGDAAVVASAADGDVLVFPAHVLHHPSGKQGKGEGNSRIGVVSRLQSECCRDPSAFLRSPLLCCCSSPLDSHSLLPGSPSPCLLFSLLCPSSHQVMSRKGPREEGEREDLSLTIREWLLAASSLWEKAAASWHEWQTAVILVTDSARGTSATTFSKGRRCESPSRAETTTVAPELAHLSAYSVKSLKNCNGRGKGRSWHEPKRC